MGVVVGMLFFSLFLILFSLLLSRTRFLYSLTFSLSLFLRVWVCVFIETCEWFSWILSFDRNQAMQIYRSFWIFLSLAYNRTNVFTILIPSIRHAHTRNEINWITIIPITSLLVLTVFPVFVCALTFPLFVVLHELRREMVSISQWSAVLPLGLILLLSQHTRSWWYAHRTLRNVAFVSHNILYMHISIILFSALHHKITVNQACDEKLWQKFATPHFEFRRWCIVISMLWHNWNCRPINASHSFHIQFHRNQTGVRNAVA